MRSGSATRSINKVAMIRRWLPAVITSYAYIIGFGVHVSLVCLSNGQHVKVLQAWNVRSII